MKSNELRDFYETIWGHGAGTRFISTMTPGKAKTWRDHAFQTNEEAAAFALAEIKRGKEVFSCPQLFKIDSEHRLAKNAIGSRALWLDIDVKPDNRKCYESKKVALLAVKPFIDSTHIPEPIIIDSGNGVHLYWIFQQMLSADEWDQRAKQLDALAKTQGLKADGQITKDKARAMRLPGSDNRKDPGEPKPCKILVSGSPVEFETVAAILDEHSPLTFTPEDYSNDKFLAGIESSSQDTREVAALCVPFLSADRCDEYSEWLSVGIALRHIFNGAEEGLRLWDDWSRSSSKYREGECAKRWSTFSERPEFERIGVGSLVMRAKSDSAEFASAWDTFKFERRSEALSAKAGTITLTENGNAQRLVALYGQDIRYDDGRGIWYAWTGKYWKERADTEVMQFAKATVKAIYIEAGKTNDDGRRKELAKWAKSSESGRSLRETVRLAESDAEIQTAIGDFDRHPNLLCVENGVVDLRTGALLPHDREMMLSRYVPIRYDPAATCPIFEKFMFRIFDGNHNLIKYMLKALGYSLTAETREQVFFICYGEGANGKSTLIETVHCILGDLAGTVRTEALMQNRFGGSNGHNDDIASLHGKRFVSAVETDSGQRLAESSIKQLTGGDAISASRKYGRAFKFNPIFKLFLAANHKPQIAGTDEGIWRRIRLLPFTVRIPESDRDPDLKEKLRGESEGIFARLVRGAVAWYAQGLGIEPDVAGATTAYRSEQDTVENFLRDCCEIGTEASVVPSVLYEHYRQWCFENGYEILNRQQFPAELQKRGYRKHTVKRSGMAVTVWQGLGIRSAFSISSGTEIAPAISA